MMRAGYYYGTLNYETDKIPTLGASNSPPHAQAIKEIQNLIDAEIHPIRTRLRKFFKNKN